MPSRGRPVFGHATNESPQVSQFRRSPRTREPFAMTRWFSSSRTTRSQLRALHVWHDGTRLPSDGQVVKDALQMRHWRCSGMAYFTIPSRRTLPVFAVSGHALTRDVDLGELH